MNIHNILFSFAMFTLLMFAFGQATSAPAIANISNQIFAPLPSLGDTIKALNNCQFTDAGCIANNVALATGNIANGLIWIGTLLFTVAYRFTLFETLMVIFMTSPQASLASVPFGLFIFGAFLVVLVVELFKLIRGNAIAGV